MSPALSSLASSFEDNETIERPPPANVVYNEKTNNNNATAAAANKNDDDNYADATNDAECVQMAERMYLRAQGAVRTAADTASLRLLLTHDVFDVGQGLVQQIVYTGKKECVFFSHVMSNRTSYILSLNASTCCFFFYFIQSETIEH